VTTHHEAQEQRAAEYFGLRPSKASVCPRVVAGKRCLIDSRGKCVCQDHYRVLDHGRMWLDENGHHVLTGEPYNTWGEEMTAFVAAMDELGLHVHLSGRSLWYPGYTLLVRVTRKD
ncbi:hypothetical protein JYK22_05145, partial [Nonomuraea sp. RK-328]|nr:hypothetical protein [Nonomuraea sp. RK-328]